MTVIRGTRKWIDNFDRPLTLSTTPEGGTGWTIADTSSAGTPTYLTQTGDCGELKITLAATSEAEIVTLYHNDVLMYDIRELQHMWWVLQVADVDAVTTLVAGFGNAQNDTADTVGVSAWFRMEGSVSTTNVVLETDDVTNNNDDVASGDTLAAVFKKLHLDLSDGLDKVKFYMDGERVGGTTTFDMSDVAAGQNVQPMVQLQKASGTGTPSVTIAQFGVQTTYAYGE